MPGKGDRLTGMLSKGVRPQEQQESKEEVTPERPQEDVIERLSESTLARNTDVKQSRDTESMKEGKQEVVPSYQRYITKERPKKNMIEGSDGIWREKSGYAFDPARVNRLKRIAFEMEQEKGEKKHLYQLMEEGMDYIIAKYASYERQQGGRHER